MFATIEALKVFILFGYFQAATSRGLNYLKPGTSCAIGQCCPINLGGKEVIESIKDI